MKMIIMATSRDIVEDEVINILQDIQEVNNEDIPLVRDDIEPDLVEARFCLLYTSPSPRD